MTIFYPDISGFQAGIRLGGTVAVCCKATESDNYANPDYGRAKASAKANNAFFFAYHFLHHGNISAQARWCHNHVGSTPLMLDVEPTGSSSPNMTDTVAFVRAYRALGGVIHLIYLPHWHWQNIGSPSLSVLPDNLRLVSSNYVSSYSNAGPGWAAYGGMNPTIWQYTDKLRFNGFNVDFNAFKGSGGNVNKTLTEFKSIVRTGHYPVLVPKIATNPVPGGLFVTPRYTQAEVTWQASPGARSYHVNVWTKGLKRRIRSFDTHQTHVTIHNLTSGHHYVVTVLAEPATKAAVLSGRARKSFQMKR